MILEQQTEIDATPDAIFGFFDHMEEHYTRWHPDHIVFRWLGESGLATGNAFYIEERINGQHLKRAMRFTRIEPGRHIEFAPENRFVRLFLPRILFAIETTGSRQLLTQRLHIRIGPIGRWLNRKGFAAVQRHMREEGENMKALLEARP